MGNEERVQRKYIERIDKDLSKEAGHLTEDDAPNMIESIQNPGYTKEYESIFHIGCKHEKMAESKRYYIDCTVVDIRCVHCGHIVNEGIRTVSTTSKRRK